MPTLIENRNLEGNLLLCQEIGFQFVELNMNFPQYQIEGLEQVEKLLKLKEQYGIYFTIHLDENMNVCDFNRSVTKAYLETVERTIAVAKKLSAPIINMHMNHGIHITLPDRKVQLYEQYNEHYMEDMKRFRDLCEKHIGIEDIKISIENTDGFRAYEKDAIEYLLNSDVFTLTWDIGHSYVENEKDVSFIKAHQERLRHFHIHDATTSSNHLMLGTGEIDLENRLQYARQCGARAVIETKTIAALKGSVQWLRQCNSTKHYLMYK